jgi:hypothetical protein
MLWHIIDRSLIHLFSSIGCVVSMFFTLRSIARHKRDWPIPEKINIQLFICCLLVVLVAFIREPFDVSQGDPAYKSYIDLSAWMVGCIASYIGIKRLIIMSWD